MKMVEVDEDRLKKIGIKKPPRPCDCGSKEGYKYDTYTGETSGVTWVLATCKGCRRQKIWNDGVKIWMGLEPDKMVVV